MPLPSFLLFDKSFFFFSCLAVFCWVSLSFMVYVEHFTKSLIKKLPKTNIWFSRRHLLLFCQFIIKGKCTWLLTDCFSVQNWLFFETSGSFGLSQHFNCLTFLLLFKGPFTESILAILHPNQAPICVARLFSQRKEPNVNTVKGSQKVQHLNQWKKPKELSASEKKASSQPKTLHR